MMSVISPMCTDADGLVQCLHWLTDDRCHQEQLRARVWYEQHPVFYKAVFALCLLASVVLATVVLSK